MQCIPDGDILDMSASGEHTVEFVVTSTVTVLLILLLSENRSLVRLRFASGRALSVWGETPILLLVSLVRFLLRDLPAGSCHFLEFSQGFFQGAEFVRAGSAENRSLESL